MESFTEAPIVPVHNSIHHMARKSINKKHRRRHRTYPQARHDQTLPSSASSVESLHVNLPNQAPINIANPAPLGLAAYALSTFLLGAIGLHTQGMAVSNIVVAPSLGFTGLSQVLAGMWYFALGDTFGATTMTAFGGFWISWAMINIPGTFEIRSFYTAHDFNIGLGLFLVAWGVLIFIFWTCTLRGSVATSLLYLTAWVSFCLQGTGYLLDADGTPNETVLMTGAGWAIFSSMVSFWMTWTSLWASKSTGFFVVPELRMPWSIKATPV